MWATDLVSIRVGGQSWVLAVHGGAKEIAARERPANRDGCAAALAAGRAILAQAGSALDAVEAVIRALEDDPTFNAGRGSALNAVGEVEMCAAIMSGLDLAVGAVAVVKGVPHPIGVARQLLEEEEILLAGPGARDFARRRGLLAQGPGEERPPLIGIERRSSHDTVGAVALDQQGNVAAATSTGGLARSRPGRVGDSPLPGGGYYADNHLGAVALSGHGEAIARQCVAIRVMDNIEALGPQAALQRGVDSVRHLGSEAGGILLTKDGEFAWAHNSPHFPVGLATADCPEGRSWLDKDEA